MSRLAHLHRMDEPLSAPDLRPMYEALLERAMRHAERHLTRDEAFEVAHDVALELLRQSAGDVSSTLIYMRVNSRMRSLWRDRERRASLDGAYVEMRSGIAPAWAQPGAELEARELRERIAAVVAAMPSGMRDAFLLVREEELSYRDAAARLGVSVGTVHTQLSRANALLRACVQRYHGAVGAAPNSPKERRP